ncbi:hypothetical protein K6119_10740 [Paracrocinitomix mangrovi]|uniref:hypothetical protein n=1 Tax=Paracrocinitomix mangrovi TaxID=2862509 RepID=UPI001C8E7882|nr:hypothetical protein [Paracrocinitomix mangrovi]UKN00209.1 hypothetical protein K6119_10740 [Paracrocinitomix mangrovi]
MAIKNNKELEEKVNEVSALLKEISKYIGASTEDIDRKYKIEFPRGYIRTAEQFRLKLTCIEDYTTKTNIAYQLMLSDLFTWLLNRTDIFGTVKEMIIKYQIAIMGSIVETITKQYVPSNKKGFTKRIDKMVEEEIITEHIGDECKWLWEIRTGIHLFELSEQEYGKYKSEHFDRATLAARALISHLNSNKE